MANVVVVLSKNLAALPRCSSLPFRMKGSFNGTILVVLTLCLVSAIVAFGGITPEFAAPMYVSASALAILWSAKLLLSKQASWTKSAMHWPVAAFVVYAAARYFTSPIEYASRLELLHVGMYAVVYFVAACNLPRSRDRNVIVAVLLIIALTESVFGLWQFVHKSDQVFGIDRPAQYHGRGSGTYICPNHLAGLLEIAFSVVLARIVIARSLTNRTQKNVLMKLLEIYVALFIIAGLYSTLSRGGWIAAAMAVLVFLFWARRAHAASSNAIAGGLLACLVAAGVIISLPSLRHRIAEVFVFRVDYVPDVGPFELRDPSIEGRALMWRTTLKIVRDHLPFGTGPNTWQWFHLKYRDPRFQGHPEFAHSDVLQLASDYGLLGFILVSAIVVCFFREAVRLSAPTNRFSRSAFAIGVTTAVTAILVHSLVDFNMHIPANALLIATLMGLTVAMDDSDERPRQTVLPRAARVVLALVLLAVGTIGMRTGLRAALADHYRGIGNAFKVATSWNVALENYSRALAFEPKLPAVYAGIGDVYRMQSALRVADPKGNEQEEFAMQSESAYLEAVALNPFESEVWLRLAVAYELAGEIDGARRCYDEALACDPNNMFNFLRLGIFLLRNGDEARGLAALQRSAELKSPDATKLLQELQQDNPQSQ